MTKHPYKMLPESSFWKSSLTETQYQEVDPLKGSPVKFKLTSSMRIASAGSCFAQHITHQLKQHRCNFFITEQPPFRLDPQIAAEYNYGTFSARYGNIYNTKHLVQLFDRAYDYFEPLESCWEEGENHFIDPFRPNIQPNGFYTKLEFNLDRQQHLLAVRHLFENLDVFIFTLGLTEYWYHKEDGAVFPLCPGVSGGTFDPLKHLFHNANVSETIQQIEVFFEKLKKVNSRAKMILTISPVPLVATASANHVLPATIYSKSVLRAAAEELTQNHADIAYFPSYELITGYFNRGRYFSDDLRTVTQEGVNHVMKIFFTHYFDLHYLQVQENPIPASQESKPKDHIESLLQQQCDEVLLEVGY